MHNKSSKGISIFFPCYNDEKSIVTLVSNADKVVQKLTKNYELIVIDDCSTDNSREALKKLKGKYKKLKLIFHKKNKGYGGSLKSGFKAATKDLIFYTDGDGQYDVYELPILFSLMTPGTDFVNGIKMARSDSTYRIWIGNIYSFFIRWTFWIPVYDVDCDFRLIRKNVIDKISLTSNSGSICVELVKKSQQAGARFRQVSIHHFERKHGKSQFFRFDRILSTFKDLANLWINLIIKK